MTVAPEKATLTVSTEPNMGEIPVTPKGRRTRAGILNAARKVFARHGYVGMRMADVAAEAKLSMGALYRYFKNKEDLFANLIEDIHEVLLNSSRALHTDFRTDPYAALLEANRGYLEHYYENRDVMRAFFEAMTVDERYRKIWWTMRAHHVERFVHSLKKDHGITEIDGVNVTVITEAMASMVEQSAYCWYAQEELYAEHLPIDVATKAVTVAWYQAFFK